MSALSNRTHAAASECPQVSKTFVLLANGLVEWSMNLCILHALLQE